MVIATPRTLGARRGLFSLTGTDIAPIGNSIAFAMCQGYSASDKCFLYVGVDFFAEVVSGFFVSGQRAVYGVSYDSTASTTCKIYKNGVVAASGNLSASHGAVNNASSTFSVGAALINATNPGDVTQFDGSIELVVLNKGLWTDAQFKQLYENPWQIFAPTPPPIYFGAPAASGSFNPAWAIGSNASVIGSGIHA